MEGDIGCDEEVADFEERLRSEEVVACTGVTLAKRSRLDPTYGFLEGTLVMDNLLFQLLSLFFPPFLFGLGHSCSTIDLGGLFGLGRGLARFSQRLDLLLQAVNEGLVG